MHDDGNHPPAMALPREAKASSSRSLSEHFSISFKCEGFRPDGTAQVHRKKRGSFPRDGCARPTLDLTLAGRGEVSRPGVKDADGFSEEVRED